MLSITTNLTRIQSHVCLKGVKLLVTHTIQRAMTKHQIMQHLLCLIVQYAL